MASSGASETRIKNVVGGKKGLFRMNSRRAPLEGMGISGRRKIDFVKQSSKPEG